MKMTVLPSRVSGTVDAVPSKSHAHRLLIAAALADAPAKVICPALSRDIERTAECLAALGAAVTRTEDGFEVTPISKVKKGAVLNAGESGFHPALPAARRLRAGRGRDLYGGRQTALPPARHPHGRTHPRRSEHLSSRRPPRHGRHVGALSPPHHGRETCGRRIRGGCVGELAIRERDAFRARIARQRMRAENNRECRLGRIY